MSINQILSKISFLTIRWDYSFSFMNIYLRDKNTFWGISILSFSNPRRKFSLFECIFVLPNMTNYRNLICWSFDFFFLKNYMVDQWEKERERIIWSKEYRDKTIFSRFAQKLNNFMKR